MKKLICLLVIAIMAVFTIPAISADTTLNMAGGASAESELSYSVPSSYEIIIPSFIGLNQDYVFGAAKMNIRNDEKINVYCADYSGIILTNADGDTITVTLNGNNNGIVGVFYKDDVSSRIPMTANAFFNDNTSAGEYTGTTTFSLTASSRN